MQKPLVDYSLYLVTDSTEAILGERNLVDVVEQAIAGGVTVVQYRDKTSDTGVLIHTAKELHKICQKGNVPLIVNDRVDVVLAVGCEGVHLGQDDMDIVTARKILGQDKIIGATVSSIKEAQVAVEAGADYLGIGTLYATATKKDTKSIIGINGIRKILYYLSHQKDDAAQIVKSVCIGGVNASNVQRVRYQLHPPSGSQPQKVLDGVAIVSAIMAAEHPQAAASHLKLLLDTPPPFKVKSTTAVSIPETEQDEINSIRTATTKAIVAVSNQKPLSHNMTNLVVQNFAANVALCIGASPIMSNNGDEAPDLARLGGGLVINMGTATPDSLANHQKAIEAYNSVGGPIVLDPVGAGATAARKEALAFLMASGYFDLIKGNEREIMAVARASGFVLHDSESKSSQQRGVDSGTSLFSFEEKAYLVSRIALRERNVVLMTGKVDIVSDGMRTYSISNGHSLLGEITGSGCALGTTLAAYMAANPEDKLLACVAGIVHYDVAGQVAGAGDVQGPGTFIPAFLDQLSKTRTQVMNKAYSDIAFRMEVKPIKNIPDCGLLREL
ncbi:TMP-TENI-domain-containing protein [Lindgomyces ingoldianus]|uniref:TMP-TENI-domain-containing protein n=1 Tax=Lindgomyces ingoldianus TaxID=673940 RepID=A0ACB6RE27_9PLEO|nr:TMP-TENI-domain-containing protein [Lindgomyces ingoldianus]KAF2477604.1 TMP-TENI-domain-containing protein [Lindgomyces ingoldianus]